MYETLPEKHHLIKVFLFEDSVHQREKSLSSEVVANHFAQNCQKFLEEG